jgi:hypothetical protein
MAHLIVKLLDSTELAYVDGVNTEFTGPMAIAWQAVVAVFPSAGLLRLFDGLEGDELAALMARAQTYGERETPRLDVYFQLVVDDALASAVTAAIEAMPEVELVYEQPPVVTTCIDPLQPSANPLSAGASYLLPGPDGVGGGLAFLTPGGSGDGVNFADMERGWLLTHEDLAAAGIVMVSGVMDPLQADHGTAVLDVVLGQDNDVGLLGIVSDVHAIVSSGLRSGGTYSPAAAIIDLAKQLGTGDVLLLEQQFEDSPGQKVPLEWRKAERDAITTAVNAGMVVVEPASNSERLLDTIPAENGVHFLDRTVFDSGAIMVGVAQNAAAPGGGHARRPGAGHGNRLDCYALDGPHSTASSSSNNAYHAPGQPVGATFNATSAASAIIAGAVCAFQGMALALTGAKWTPWTLRSAFSDATNGTTSPDDIGVMPDLWSLSTLLASGMIGPDLLAAQLSDGVWLTIGQARDLIYVGKGDVVSVENSTGSYDVWRVDRQSTGDPIPGVIALASATIPGFDGGHRLSYWGKGQILDWVPTTGAYRLWRYDRSTHTFAPAPTTSGTWSTIRSGHELVYIGRDLVLDWVPSTKGYRVWAIDRSVTSGDPLSNQPTSAATWISIGSGHKLIYLSEDRLVDWVPATGNYRLFSIDYTPGKDPVPGPARLNATFPGIAATERMFYIDGNRLITWDPPTGRYRLWRLDASA